MARTPDGPEPEPAAPLPPAEGAPPGDLRRELLAWYDAHRRTLPWRGGADPYRVWVSEVMLQQTRVETVVPYYRRWVERFPDLPSLAAADPEEVLGVWQGLGYYSRARNLHRAARVVMERHGGRLPDDPTALRDLPGVGEYTAGAVASIAFGRAEPAVDGNVRRVLARLADDPRPRPARLRAWAAELVDPARPGAFNQALMELGATVCTPSRPDCGACPLARFCAARRHGTQEDRPAGRKRGPARALEVAVAVPVVRVDGEVRFLLRRRPGEGLLGGMWEFPGVEVPEGTGAGARRRAARELARKAGLESPDAGASLPAVHHAFSHRRARYHPFLFVGTGAAVPPPADGRDGEHRSRAAIRLVAPGETGALPLPVAQRKIERSALESLGG